MSNILKLFSVQQFERVSIRQCSESPGECSAFQIVLPSLCFSCKSHSFVSDSVSLWTIACQAPQSMEFSRQEHWSAQPFPSPGNFSDPGIKPGSPALQADSLPSEPAGKPIQGMYSQMVIPVLGTKQTLSERQWLFSQLPPSQMIPRSSILQHTTDLSGGPDSRVSDSVGLEQGWRIHTSNKFPGVAVKLPQGSDSENHQSRPFFFYLRKYH